MYNVMSIIRRIEFHSDNKKTIKINPAKPEYRNMCPKKFFYSYLR